MLPSQTNPQQPSSPLLPCHAGKSFSPDWQDVISQKVSYDRSRSRSTSRSRRTSTRRRKPSMPMPCMDPQAPGPTKVTLHPNTSQPLMFSEPLKVPRTRAYLGHINMPLPRTPANRLGTIGQQLGREIGQVKQGVPGVEIISQGSRRRSSGPPWHLGEAAAKSLTGHLCASIK